MKAEHLEEVRDLINSLATVDEVATVQDLLDERRKVLVDGQRNLD
ncbi:hypothetical protein [Weissella soli]|jgi:hypothetical protein|uniref:Uncharacterized protein n=1 Tax=Weissella soli TaxID=155866 RepID=A0A288QY09_9LACO|nr:hypothetical protein [Weissella soli]AOT57043.1 hypothetical protein WSWS_01454 [Weissella soli]RDL05215.1 hypothetical protein DFP99_1154 [Weissella soli]GEN93950.1 hypothetical protein WSO01_15620 [Weissella soli]GJM48781.1 hypothetical protein WSSLDB02_13380 [Weissella soli]